MAPVRLMVKGVGSRPAGIALNLSVAWPDTQAQNNKTHTDTPCVHAHQHPFFTSFQRSMPTGHVEGIRISRQPPYTYHSHQ
eukprot:794859-Rhodomonas_salina.3